MKAARNKKRTGSQFSGFPVRFDFDARSLWPRWQSRGQVRRT
jgi:hypothetical protein